MLTDPPEDDRSRWPLTWPPLFVLSSDFERLSARLSALLSPLCKYSKGVLGLESSPLSQPRPPSLRDKRSLEGVLASGLLPGVTARSPRPILCSECSSRMDSELEPRLMGFCRASMYDFLKSLLLSKVTESLGRRRRHPGLLRSVVKESLLEPRPLSLPSLSSEP